MFTWLILLSLIAFYFSRIKDSYYKKHDDNCGCKDNHFLDLRCICGKSKTAKPEPLPSAAQQAGDLNAAANQYDPEAARREFNIYTNPEYGALPLTQYDEMIRKTVLPGETGVRNQLLDNILGQLQSPTGITADQQSAIDSRRQLSQNNLVSALRTRANLGGGLYGGRSALQEGRQVGELQNIFAEEDINREQAARQQASTNAMQALQLLYPQLNIHGPQYNSVVQSPGQYSNSLMQQQQLNYQAAQQAAANKAAMQSALFQALGTAAGAAVGGPGGAMIGGQAGKTAGGGSYAPIGSMNNSDISSAWLSR